MDYEIVDIPDLGYNSAVAGSYVVDDETVTDKDPSEWIWLNSGNGPEIAEHGVFGPFGSEDEARLWADAQYR